MPTFIVKNNPQLNLPIELTKDDEHHLRKVLRVKTEEIFSVTDNNGMLGKVKILNTNPFQFELIEKQMGAKPFPITMYLPLIDQDRLEWAIEKLTELNSEAVQLVITERTQYKNLKPKKLERLQKISEAAQKQCGRAYPLKIYPEKKLRDCSFSKKDLNLVATINASKRHPAPDAGPRHVNLFIGPEGGFSEGEEKFLVENGCQKTSLGPTTLRTETAAISLASLISI